MEDAPTENRPGNLNPATILTLSRIVLAPVFVVFFSINGTTAAFLALFIAALSELSDLLDGIVARKTGNVTELGKILDPLSDSIARFTVFLCFLKAGIAPIGFVLLIFYRDIIVATIRTYCGLKGIVVSARSSGKIKAIFQASGIIIILCVRFLSLYLDRQEPTGLYLIIMGIVTLVTIWSGIDYFIGAGLLKDRRYKS